MTRKEIIIPRPQENNVPGRDFSYTHGWLSNNKFDRFCAVRKITPDTHPLACDLFAGLGAMSLILNSRGWEPNNITCIDVCKPNPDELLISNAQWLHWDLKELTRAIINNEDLPPKVTENQSQYDLVVMAYNVTLESEWEYYLTGFFAKDNGDSLIVPSRWMWVRKSK